MGIFLEHRVVSICMFVFLFLSMFLRIILGALYNHLIKEADSMASTNNKLLKQCKNKYMNCCEMNQGMNNVTVYVDKFIQKLSFGPFSFRTIYYLSCQMILISVILAGIGVCLALMDGNSVQRTVPYYIVSFIGLYLYFTVSTAVDLKGRKNMLRINLIDYLENHLSQRLKFTRKDMEMLNSVRAEEGSAAAKPRKIEVMNLTGAKDGDTKEHTETKITQKATWDEIEHLLKEILIG